MRSGRSSIATSPPSTATSLAARARARQTISPRRRSRSRFAGRSAFRPSATTARPWLFGIATNLLRNDRRAEFRLLRALSRLAAGEPTLHPDLAHEGSSEVTTALADALADMDADQRDVLLLHAWAELSYDEIAASLAIPLGTVRSRLSRARARLRSALATAIPEGSPR